MSKQSWMANFPFRVKVDNYVEGESFLEDIMTIENLISGFQAREQDYSLHEFIKQFVQVSSRDL